MPDTTPARAYHHGNLKEALVTAGISLLEEEGLANLSLRAIAARVGVSHTAPKNHFGSLRGLLTAIAAEGFHRHANYMKSGSSDRKARFRAAMEGYVRFAQDHPALFALMFSAELCDYADPALRTAGAESYGVLASIARDLDWDKSGLPGAQRRAEMMLWSLSHGYAQLAVNGLFMPVSPEDSPDGHLFGISDVMPDFGYLMRG